MEHRPMLDKIKATLKTYWRWILSGLILVVAFGFWVLSMRRSPWAAQKILDIQGDTEDRVEKIKEKASDKLSKLDASYHKKRTAILDKAKAEADKAKETARTLKDATELRRKLMDDLDDPL